MAPCRSYKRQPMHQAHSRRFIRSIESTTAESDHPPTTIKSPFMLETNFKRTAAGAHSRRRKRPVEILTRLTRLVLTALGLVSLATGPAIAAEAGVRQIDIADYRPYLPDDHPVRQGMRKF